MHLGVYLSNMTRPELESTKELLNLTDEEEEVFVLLSKGKSRDLISSICNISLGTVNNRILAIKKKVVRIGEYQFHIE